MNYRSVSPARPLSHFWSVKVSISRRVCILSYKYFKIKSWFIIENHSSGLRLYFQSNWHTWKILKTGPCPHLILILYLKKVSLFIYFVCVCAHACMCVCMCACRSQKRCQILWSWTYRRLWTAQNPVLWKNIKVLNHWAITPTSRLPIIKKKLTINTLVHNLRTNAERHHYIYRKKHKNNVLAHI